MYLKTKSFWHLTVACKSRQNIVLRHHKYCVTVKQVQVLCYLKNVKKCKCGAYSPILAGTATHRTSQTQIHPPGRRVAHTQVTYRSSNVCAQDLPKAPAR